MNDPILDNLIQSGDIASYALETIEEYPGSNMREADRLTMVLPSGKLLIINTFCSGSSENTSLLISNQKE